MYPKPAPQAERMTPGDEAHCGNPQVDTNICSYRYGTHFLYGSISLPECRHNRDLASSGRQTAWLHPIWLNFDGQNQGTRSNPKSPLDLALIWLQFSLSNTNHLPLCQIMLSKHGSQHGRSPSNGISDTAMQPTVLRTPYIWMCA